MLVIRTVFGVPNGNGTLWVIRGSRVLPNGLAALYDKNELALGSATVWSGSPPGFFPPISLGDVANHQSRLLSLAASLIAGILIRQPSSCPGESSFFNRSRSERFQSREVATFSKFFNHLPVESRYTGTGSVSGSHGATTVDCLIP